MCTGVNRETSQPVETLAQFKDISPRKKIMAEPLPAGARPKNKGRRGHASTHEVKLVLPTIQEGKNRRKSSLTGFPRMP